MTKDIILDAIGTLLALALMPFAFLVYLKLLSIFFRLLFPETAP